VKILGKKVGMVSYFLPSGGCVGATLVLVEKDNEVISRWEKVDCTSMSKGKGFAGVMKRFNAKGQPESRGTHEYRRHIGAIGGRKFPGRVFKGQSMPGRMGGKQVTTLGLKVLGYADGVLSILGAVPGATGSKVSIRSSNR